MLVIVVLLAAVVVFFAIEHFKTLKREQKKKVGKQLGVFGAISALLLLIVTGKFAALAAIGTGLVVFAKRVFPFLTYLPFFKNLFNKIGTGSRRGSSQQSTVETSLLRMTLDHESGELDGELLDTVSKGKYLSDFGMSDLISLYALAGTQYPDSTEVLATYLDRKYGDDWREAANAEGNSRKNTNTCENGKMTKSEAYEVLGLDENASEADVIAAHRKLMLKLHPDRGGSSYLAAKLNEAKDMLLDGYGT